MRGGWEEEAKVAGSARCTLHCALRMLHHTPYTLHAAHPVHRTLTPTLTLTLTLTPALALALTLCTGACRRCAASLATPWRKWKAIESTTSNFTLG